MATTRCDYCHEEIPNSEYKAHVRAHQKRRADGQQTDYATLPASERSGAVNAFESAPQVYVHTKCGVATQMPDEIIQTYLQDPWYYASDETFCCGCQDHVPNSECVWEETNQNVQAYMDDLREGIPAPKLLGCLGLVLFAIASIGSTISLALAN